MPYRVIAIALRFLGHTHMAWHIALGLFGKVNIGYARRSTTIKGECTYLPYIEHSTMFLPISDFYYVHVRTEQLRE